jgi:hypothetical protein
MHRPETKKGRWKFFATNKVHEKQCIGLNGEFCNTILCLQLASSVESRLNTWDSTSVDFQWTTWHYIPEDSTLQILATFTHHESFKSYLNFEDLFRFRICSCANVLFLSPCENWCCWDYQIIVRIYNISSINQCISNMRE